MPETPEDRAVELHYVLLEVLKQLNRAEQEERDVEGVEPAEILVHLRRGPCPTLPEADLDAALGTLVANRMAKEEAAPAYAWDRGRMLGRRFHVTTEGKEFLLASEAKAGRVD